MLITKEQQQSWVDTYVREMHSQDECSGFIDGVEKAIGAINNAHNQTITDGRRNLLTAFISEVKREFKDENWDYLDFIADRVLNNQS